MELRRYRKTPGRRAFRSSPRKKGSRPATRPVTKIGETAGLAAKRNSGRESGWLKNGSSLSLDQCRD
jgi:hypothetical protein